MIRTSLVQAMLGDIKKSFASTDGLLSLTVHGSYANNLEDRHYADIDLIFLFEDDSLQSGLIQVERYFSTLIKADRTTDYRVLYRTQSGPMHPLRPLNGANALIPLKDLPVLFFHISVFPLSFYSATRNRGERPSRLLLYSWQSFPHLLGRPLREFTAVDHLEVEDVLLDGLGIRDCLAMLRTRSKNFWEWQMQPDGTPVMAWGSAPLEDIELFELPLYAFKWCVSNSTRILRGMLPLRKDLPDLVVFQRFMIPNTLKDLSQCINAHLARIDELRLQFTEDPQRFWREIPDGTLYGSVTRILEGAERQLKHIDEFNDSEYSFLMNGQKVSISMSIDLKKGLNATLRVLNPDCILMVSDSDLRQIYDPVDLLSDVLAGAAPVILSPKDKSIKSLMTLLNQAEQLRLTSGSLILPFGGGSVGNTAGTAAGLICRGTRLVHIPTTLVAQLDSAVGGKQSINGNLGKNYIGLFHAPEKVLLQPLFLLSLDYERILDGLVEALKHGLCQDDSLVGLILQYVDHRNDQPFDLLVSIMKRTIELKLEYLQVDPLEKDPETHLELGHKIGHAIEFLFKGNISHGQSVAFGMLAEGLLLASLGKTSARTFDYMRNSIIKVISDCQVFQPIAPLYVAEQLCHDNKRSGAYLPFSYLSEPQSPGSCRFKLDSHFLEDVISAVHKTKELLGCSVT